MSSFYQKVIRIISKASEKREDEELHMILPWFINLFKKKATVFGDVDSEVVKDIIKNCSFETKKLDEIIIKQGDVGDCFYINLRGKVSIYINHKKHDEADMGDDVNENNESLRESNEFSDVNQSPNRNSANFQNKNKKFREKLGNYVTSLGAGEGFGEIALVSDDTRTASIIADETTDLMVVNKTLYARCLQAPTLRKLSEKQNFINSSPFFGNWSPKMKKLLSLCLERDIIPYDSYLGKQGEVADKMFFIISGQAKVTVNPMMHKSQYPRMYPLKQPENEDQEIIFSWIERKHAPNSDPKNSINQKFSINSNSILKRRNETFAEAEQRNKIKNIEVGILGPGEISGMCELIFDMPTYMQSTRCQEDCDVFYIFKRSYERLIEKRNPSCINKMKDNVYVKLVTRNNRLKASVPVDLFRCLQYKIELSKRKRSQNETNSSNSYFNSKSLTNLPPRGPIIQLDLRPKTAAYNKMKKLKQSRTPNRVISVLNDEVNKQKEIEAEIIENSTLSSNEFRIDNEGSQHSTNIDDATTVTITKIDNPNEPISQAEIERVVNFNPTSVNESLKEDLNNTMTNTNLLLNKLESNTTLNETELEKLEDRIKRFHLDFGAKKAFVTKLNRIDKLKPDIKVGGNIYIKRNKSNQNDSNNTSSSNTTNRVRSRSSSNDSSSSESFGLEYDADYLAYINRYLRMNNSRGSRFNSHSRNSLALTQSALNFIPNIASFNNTDNKGNFINSFITYVEPDSNESCSIDPSSQLQTPHLIALESLFTNTFTNESPSCIVISPNYLNNAKKYYNLKKNSFLAPNDSSLFINYDLTNSQNQTGKDTSVSMTRLDQITKSPSDVDTEFQTNQHQQSSQNNLNNSNSKLFRESSKINMNNCKITIIDQKKSDSSNNLSCNNNNNRKKSMPNLIFNDKRNSSEQFSPYIVRRKFSMGQIKIQHTGKQYSKEEYIALKDELKKQSRRYSISSAHS